MDTISNYRADIPGLDVAVKRCEPEPKHQSLLACLQGFEALARARLTATRADSWLSRRKVLDAAGRIVSDDHELWLEEQLRIDGGRAANTYERLKGQGYLLSQCAITTLYVASDRGSRDESDFLQARIDVEDEWTERPLFSDWPHSLRDLKDLIESPGYELDKDKRTRVRPMTYQVAELTDVKRFVQEAIALDQLQLQALRRRRFVVQADHEPHDRILSYEEAFPGFDPQPAKWGRIFADWALSSAGRSGARLCDHWAMQLSDYTSPEGKRSMSLVPVWGTTLKLAKVEGGKGNMHELIGKLTKLDGRVHVPFAWFFFMLHGNRVDDAAGHRMLKAAEAGHVVLPEHDYRVLKNWEKHPYGF